MYCISGAATVSLLNPFTKQIQNYPITPGQVANVPQGWWHYEVANADNTHLLAIFNAPTPEVILGSDILKLTPANIMAHTYCMDENQWKKAIAPVQPSTFIGPPANCHRAAEESSSNILNILITMITKCILPRHTTININPIPRMIIIEDRYW